MSVRSDSEIIAELECLLREAIVDLSEAQKCLENKNREDCTDACVAAQQKVQQALKFLLGMDKV